MTRLSMSEKDVLLFVNSPILYRNPQVFPRLEETKYFGTALNHVVVSNPDTGCGDRRVPLWSHSHHGTMQCGWAGIQESRVRNSIRELVVE